MNRISHLVLTLLLAAAVSLITACDSRETTAIAQESPASASPATSSAADPCALVSARDMGVMFGELKEGPSASTGLRNERQCNFTNMAGSWIKLSLYGGAERWEWEKGITNAQTPRTLGGLGDEAFAIRRGTDSVVYVRKGESILELSCSCTSETAEAIARVAATKL
jgi:hypothetical protein